MNNFDLKNRTAIITGGAQGFGLGIAKKFIQSGAEVIIWDIDVKTLELTKKELNGKILYAQVVDVSNYENVKKSIEEITKTKKIDIFMSATYFLDVIIIKIELLILLRLLSNRDSYPVKIYIIV